MAELSLDCPYCKTKSCGFVSAADYKARDRWAGSSRYETWVALLRCRRCSSGIVADFEAYTDHAKPSPHNCDGDPRHKKWELKRWFPSRPIAEGCPNHVPANVEQFFDEATDSLSHENWSAAGAMYRKTVDVATKSLVRKHWPEAEVEKGIKEDLIVRIERLHGRGLLTDALKDWAHQVRIGGKDAAHDEDPFTEAEAEALHQFARLFLLYTYEMPEEVRLRRETAEGA